MSPIQSSSASYPCTSPLGPYERNAKTYGPVVASVIGAAEAAGAGVQSTYRFSQEALNQLGQAVSDGAAAVAHGLSEGVSEGVDAVRDFASEVVDTVSDGVRHLGEYATSAAVAVGNALDETV